jgi:hypothetical protein
MENLKELIKAHLLFWQTYKGAPEGRRIIGYYSLNSFPSIFIIDPRTGENVYTVTSRTAIDMVAECEFF